MRNFYGYLQDRNVVGRQHRIAHLMVEQGVDPYLYINDYLDQQLLTEGWLGNFFKRIGNAWGAFWKNPNPEDSPITRLEAAKQALGQLQQMIQQNQGAEGDVLGTVLRGLEQSLTIVNKIEPTVRDLSGKMQQFAQDGIMGNDPNYQLPDTQKQKWQQIMQQLDGILKMPDSEQKLQQVGQKYDELNAFKEELEQAYQQMGYENPDKKRLENFLRRIDMDASFREIHALLDFAKRRSTQTGRLKANPEGYEEVIAQWRQIARTTRDENQQKQQLVAWYNALPPTHRIKQFVQGEARNLSKNEAEVFFDYAHSWINNYAHHLTGM